MKMQTLRVVALAAAVSLSACAGTDRVVFVTNTELGIGADTATGNANLGFSSTNVVLGPAYPETGALPEVYGAIRSDGTLFAPKVRQAYATGDAAILVSKPSNCNGCIDPEVVPQPKPKSGERRLMVFGTHSNIGFNVNFNGTLTNAINLGYKRQEISSVPLLSDERREELADHEDHYGSLLAAISLGFKDGDYNLGQLFAVGSAAENLARTESFRQSFQDQIFQISQTSQQNPAPN